MAAPPFWSTTWSIQPARCAPRQRTQRTWRAKSGVLLHPCRLIGKALENIKNSQLDELVVTDTIPLSSEALAVGKIRQLTIADLLAESIRRVSNEESISALFDLS